MKYAYAIDDEKLSREFTDLKSLFESAIENIESDNLYITENSNGEYTLELEVVETKLIHYSIDGEEVISQLKDKAYGDFVNVEWYLEDVDIKHFNEEINKFWKEYIKKNNIREIITDKYNSKKYYDIHLINDSDCYKIIDYVEK